MDPSKRFLTGALIAGVVVLLVAIAIGERAGGRVFVAAQTSGSLETTPIITPVPQSTANSNGYGPDWKRSQTITAAVDPGFPDPRVPPVPVPTPLPLPKETPRPKARWTPNPRIPIWDQTPPPSPGATPSGEPSGSVSPSPTVSPSEAPGTKSTATPQP